jgi:serine/threonine protein kinase
VWESTSPEGRRVALKFMSTQHTSATARELRALRSLHALEHPCLLKCSDVWCIPGYVVIGMELAEASLLDLFLLYADDLHEVMSPGSILRHLNHAAHALDFLNARRHLFDGRTVGFQHGDIKPNNIMIVGDTAKLADYGLATPTHGPSSPCHRHGTYDYLAPEVFRGTLTDWSDQFSLAVTYVVLRTGTFPYPPVPKKPSPNFMRDAPDLSGLASGEQPIVARALSGTPQSRFPSCVEFVRALAQVNGVTGLPVVSTPRGSSKMQIPGGSKINGLVTTGSRLSGIVSATGVSRTPPPRQ